MPSRAFGLGGRSASFGDVYGDMFDHHTVVYEYDSGAQVYALCRTQKACYGNRHDTIMGTKGTFRFRGVRGCKIEGETNWQYRGPRRSPSVAEQKALIDSVRDGRPINSGYHMANSTMVAILGQLACYSGKAITWDEAYQSNLRFGPPPEESTFDTEPPTLPDETGNYPLPIPGLTKVLG
jgi:hypothetical protein